MRIRTCTNPLSCTKRFEKLKNYKNYQDFTGIVLEIGFGQAVFIIDYAKRHPEKLIVGVEVRKRAVDLLLARLEKEQESGRDNCITSGVNSSVDDRVDGGVNSGTKVGVNGGSHGINNVLAVHGTGLFCLQDMFDDQMLEAIFVFHPDPWQRRRYYNRRLINQDFLLCAAKKLKSGGCLYISTDVQEYWDVIVRECELSGRFVIKQNDSFWQEYYSTRWTEICQNKGRTIYFATFQVCESGV